MIAVDVFSGAGGSSLGFALEGFKIAGGLEIDLKASLSYRFNLQAPVLVGDANRVSPGDFLDFLGLDSVDVMIACPPCQGFTRMRIYRLRKRGSEDPRNALAVRLLEYVGRIKPKVLVYENVPGVLEWSGGAYARALLNGLRREGYRVAYGILDAANYGAPQFRKRLILIASLDAEPFLPPPTHGDPRSAAVRARLLEPWRTVRDAIGDLPPLNAGEVHPGDPLHAAPDHGPRALAVIRAIPKDGGSRGHLPPELQLPCHARVGGFRDVYGRMRWDAPAPTVTGGVYSPSKGRYVHPEQDRGITLREAARLQGFPDDYRFFGNRHEIAAQIGNAMPVPLARALARAVKELL